MACAPSIPTIERPSSFVSGGRASDGEIGVLTTTASLEPALDDTHPEASYNITPLRGPDDTTNIAIASPVQDSPDIRGQGGSPPDSPSPPPRSTRIRIPSMPSEDSVYTTPLSLSTMTSGFTGTGSGSLALALGCLGMVPPLIYLAKAIPAPHLEIAALSASIALGGFLFYFKHAVLLGTQAVVKMARRIGKPIARLICRIVRRWLEYLDIISSVAVSLVYAVDTVTVHYLALFTVFLSVTLGGYLVSWKQSLRASNARKTKHVQIEDAVEVIGGVANEVPGDCEEALAMSTEASDDSMEVIGDLADDSEVSKDFEEALAISTNASDDTIAEIIPIERLKLPQEDVENIFGHAELDQDSVFSVSSISSSKIY